MSTLFFSSPQLNDRMVREAIDAIGLPTLGLQVKDRSYRLDLPEEFALSKKTLDERLTPLASQLGFDYAVLDPELTSDRFKLLAMDMDSTLITIECIDEIADYAGKKTEVAEITEAAMRGEIANFTESLNRRVALLKGIPESALEAVFNERLKLSPGAAELIAFAQSKGWKTLLVSGGFTFFTQKLQKQLGLDYTKANTLEVVDGQLTGKVLGEIVDGEMKKATILKTCEELGINSEQCIAMGDGANDLPMMSIAGASVAYRAKPKVQEQTDFKINVGGLDTVAKWFLS